MTLLPFWLTTAYYAVIGLAIGSFLNVVIARVPAGETLTTRSHCPRCEHPIRNRDNIPILSWLLLHAKCRDCGAPISWRYPAIEIGTAAAFAVIAWRLHITIPNALDVLVFAFAAVSIALAAIDIDTKTLPDVIVIPTFITVAATLTGWFAWQQDWRGLAVAAGAAAAYAVFYFTMWFITGGRGFGYGDVKLAPTVGAMCGAFGVEAAVVGFFAPFVLGGIPLAVLLASGVIPRGTKVPYGPLLLAGCWFGILAGAPAADTYLSIVGLK